MKLGQAYRKLARHYHPDRNPAPNATAMFRYIHDAWEYIQNEAKTRQQAQVTQKRAEAKRRRDAEEARRQAEAKRRTEAERARQRVKAKRREAAERARSADIPVALENLISMYESEGDERERKFANYYHELKAAGKDPLNDELFLDLLLTYKSWLAIDGYDLRTEHDLRTEYTECDLRTASQAQEGGMCGVVFLLAFVIVGIPVLLNFIF